MAFSVARCGSCDRDGHSAAAERVDSSSALVAKVMTVTSKLTAPFQVQVMLSPDQIQWQPKFYISVTASAPGHGPGRRNQPLFA